MAPTRGSNPRRGAANVSTDSDASFTKFVMANGLVVSTSIFGPLFLIYLTLRCEMNQCVLFQLPLVVPTHAGAYFSFLSMAIVLGFISLSMAIAFVSRPSKQKKSNNVLGDLVPPSISTMALSSMALLGLGLMEPRYMDVIFEHYLHLLVATFLFCVAFSAGLMILNALHILPKRQFEHYAVKGFFWGTHSHLRFFHIDLKSFFYINVGLIAWGLLDMLIFMHFINHRTLTGPIVFLTVSQLIFIGHSLYNESTLQEKPYKETEGLGFFWLMRVLLFLPFFQSLPVLYACVTEISLPKPIMLSDIVLFAFGFIVYLSAIHQKKIFNADPLQHKNLQFVSATGKRLLTSGYWSVVQKPDYLGYMIMWLSWAFACGLSGVSVLVLVVMYSTIFAWHHQLEDYNRKKLGPGWQRYTSAVPKKIIPFVF